MKVLQNGGPSDGVSDSGATRVKRSQFCRVRAIGTIAEVLHLDCEARKVADLALSIVRKPAVITLDPTPSVSLVRAARAKQYAFVLPCGSHNVLFSKTSGCYFKSG